MQKIKDEAVTPETLALARQKGCLAVSFVGPYLVHAADDRVAMSELAGLHQSLLARWLREVHGIHVWVEPDWERVVRDKIIDRFVACIYYMPAPPTIPKVRAGETTELALEAGLQEALKLLPDANDAPKD